MSRVIPDITNVLVPLDEYMNSTLLAAITGRSPSSDLERVLFALPAHFGGLGINLPSKTTSNERQASLLVTSSLKNDILMQDSEYGEDIWAVHVENKSIVKEQNRERSTREGEELYKQLADDLQKAVDLDKGKGASIWLTTLPLSDHEFTLHKAAFHVALAL